MRFRTKLLLLLLVIALAPMGGMRLAFVSNVRHVTERIIKETKQSLNHEAEFKMRQDVEGYASLLWAERERLEDAIRYQAWEIERLLAEPPPEHAQILLPGNFSETNGGKGVALAPSPDHFRQTNDMEIEMINVSWFNQLFLVEPGADPRKAETDEARLSRLTDMYKNLGTPPNKHVLWHITALDSGVMSMYPGHGAWPEGADFRDEPWYRESFGSRRVVWTDPFRDQVTGKIVFALVHQVFRPDGKRAGVTCLIVPQEDFLDDRRIVQNIPSGTRFFMGMAAENKAGEIGLATVAGDAYNASLARQWRSHIDALWLTSPDKDDFKALLNDMRAGKANVRRMPFDGRDSLWAYGPIMFEYEENHAFLLMISPYSEIIGMATQMETNIQKTIDNLLIWTGAGMIGVFAVVFILAWSFSKTVSRPLHELLEKTNKLAAGDFDAKTNITSKDEFGVLGDVFNSVGPRLKEHLEFTQSISLAKEVQQNLLPHKAPDIAGLEIAGLSLYCDETGGDYYDYIHPCRESDDYCITVVVGDVSGHGVQSALLMASARSSFRQRASKPGSPADIMNDVNRQLSEDVADTGQFMTVLYCSISVRNKSISWVRAGHDPAFVYDADAGEFKELLSRGVAIGLSENYVFEDSETSIESGQIIVIGTDGITEAHCAEKGMFGKSRLKDVVRRNCEKPAKDIVDAVVMEVNDFIGGREREDDVTIVVIKVL